MIYLFVARDCDMFVYEQHLEKQVQPAKFQAEIFEMINEYISITDVEARPPTSVKDLLFDNLRFHLHFDVIYYGLIAVQSFGEDKAQRVL